MKALFDQVCLECSRLTTRAYSTSFSLGILCLQKPLRDPIYSVYGFVRFADEIVDTFHLYDQRELLAKFRRDTYEAIDERISLNPILNSFQATVHRYGIERELIDIFLRSMEMDLYQNHYDEAGLKTYITGSAEAVGLMCLRIFSNGEGTMYEALKQDAMSLGSAFQKVNFLRDLKADIGDLGRRYFPEMSVMSLGIESKSRIEKSIEADFECGFRGIKKLPRSARFGVYVAYMYYLALFKKIRNTAPEKILNTRIRIDNRRKATLLAYSYVRHQLNLI
ncbi:MAG TPA: phytoene/squalene synthase family protein [Chryseosolibacter sp.]|nr:phytoene/squalene synthase family protein [Chryseosolibacter sp.]